jgi:YHS domain-containing protein
MSVKARVQFAALSFCLSVAASSVALAQHEGHDKAPAGQASQPKFSGDPYLLATDAVTGEKLGPVEKQIVVEHEGRELRFNNDEAVRTFRANPAKFLATVDAALVKQQLPFYPLETCPVSGEKLGKMGTPVDFVYRNRLVRFCCKSCTPKFLEDPDKFVAKLDAAVVAAQGPTYPLKTCIVTGEELGGSMGEPIDYVIGNRLVRICCKGCKKKIAKDPLSYLAKLDAAKPKEGDADKGHGRDHDDGHGHDGRE